MRLKGSYTIEAAIIIPIFLFLVAYCINTGINMYQQTIAGEEEKKMEEMWLVDDFYRFQIIKEVANDK